MMFKTHVMVGLFAALLMLEFFFIPNPWLFVFFVLLAAIVPDADYFKSKIGQKTKPVSWILNFLFGHRGIIHSIFVPIALYILFLSMGLPEYLGIGFVVGYLAHLFSDAMTIEGVRFLNPIVMTRIRGPVKTGGIVDWLLFFVFAGLCVWLIF